MEASNQTRPGEYRFPRSVRVWMAVGLILVPVLHLLLVLMALGCFSAAGGVVLALVYAFQHTAHGQVGLIRLALVLAVPVIALVGLGLALLRAGAMSFWHRPYFQPAIWINPNREPELTALIASICSDLGTTPPNAVILDVANDFFVTQDTFTVLNANPRGRVLAISLPLLSCLTVNELRAILYHEFAHFTGGDIRYSRFVLPVYRAVADALQHIDRHTSHDRSFAAVAVAATFKLPNAILHLYAAMFHRVNMRTSRARESRADAIAAQGVGTATLRNALQKLFGYSPVFLGVLPVLLEQIRQSPDRTESCYRQFRKRIKEWEAGARECLQASLQPYDDRYDSHPSPARRLQTLPQYPERFDDNRPALMLIRELQSYEQMAGRYMAHEYNLFRKHMGHRGGSM